MKITDNFTSDSFSFSIHSRSKFYKCICVALQISIFSWDFSLERLTNITFSIDKRKQSTKAYSNHFFTINVSHKVHCLVCMKSDPILLTFTSNITINCITIPCLRFSIVCIKKYRTNNPLSLKQHTTHQFYENADAFERLNGGFSEF